MANTYVAIAKINVGSGGASSIEFTSIPQTYTDLLLKTSIRGNRSASENQAIELSFNGVTTNLSDRWIRLVDNALASGSENDKIQYGAPGASNTASTFSNDEIYIPNYTSSNYKSVSIDNVSENNGTNVFSYLTAGLWSSTSAITSIKITAANAGTSLLEYSNFYLYGIKKD